MELDLAAKSPHGQNLLDRFRASEPKKGAFPALQQGETDQVPLLVGVPLKGALPVDREGIRENRSGTLSEDLAGAPQLNRSNLKRSWTFLTRVGLAFYDIYSLRSWNRTL